MNIRGTDVLINITRILQTNLSEARLVGVNAISSEELARGYYAKSISISRA